ncbi:MAG: ketoacyl-ACP synthase III [Treponema sp.]|nr:ketoacyl-ACP synthase III [Treponema sp.]
MAFEITGTGRAILSTKLTNDELALRIDTSDEWIKSHTGIESRYIAGESTVTSDLAAEAAKNALAMAAGYTGTDLLERDRAAAREAGSIDIIVLGTATPDYIGTPSTACITQDKLGAKLAAALDISAGCTGFVYGLETAAGLLGLSRERKRALVIGAEILSRTLDWEDRNTCVLFGDGAGAVVIEKKDAVPEGAAGPRNGSPPGERRQRGLVHTILKSDGSGNQHLLFRRGGSCSPFKKGELIDKGIHVEMDGQEVYNFAVKAVIDTVEGLIKAENIKVDDIARIIPHQANARIIQTAAKRLKIPIEKFYLNIHEYANTSSASIPIALDELNRNGSLKKGDLILTIAFGGGLTYGGNVIIW